LIWQKRPKKRHGKRGLKRDLSFGKRGLLHPEVANVFTTAYFRFDMKACHMAKEACHMAKEP